MRTISLLVIFITLWKSSRAQDTLSPERKARLEIERLKENVAGQLGPGPADLSITLSGIVNMAAGRTPFLTVSELRSGKADQANVVYLIDGLRSGPFRFEPTNTSADDGSMVVVAGNRRYVRQDIGDLRPEWFGAIPDDDKDDYAAIQNALNAATTKGISIKFASGIYLTSKPLKLKNVTSSGQFNYKITVSGDGEGRTSIKGMKGIKGDLLYMDSGNTKNRVSYVTIKDMTLAANGADRCFWASYANFIKFENVMFFGGEDVCVKIGTYGWNECYGIYFTKCYFHGGTFNGGNNNTLLQLHQTRMVVVDQMESDGGKYSIDLNGSDKATIVNSKLEGAKQASIIIRGAYGGEHKIANNLLNPYTGGDMNGQYNGSLSAIELSGPGYNNITANQILVPPPSTGAHIFTVGGFPDKFVQNASLTATGTKSGATGKISESNISEKRIYLSSTKGTFKDGETLKLSSGLTLVLEKEVVKHSYGIKASGGAFTIIMGNTIRLNPEYGIACYTEGITFNSNIVEASGWAVYTKGNMVVSGNQLGAPGKIAIERGSNNEIFASNNRILSGSQVNIAAPKSTEAVSTPNVKSLPVFENNAAAATAGVASGTLYRTATGEVRVKY